MRLNHAEKMRDGYVGSGLAAGGKEANSKVVPYTTKGRTHAKSKHRI